MSEFPLYPNAPTMVRIDADELTRLREENQRLQLQRDDFRDTAHRFNEAITELQDSRATEVARLREENQRQAERIAELEKHLEMAEKWGAQYLKVVDELQSQTARIAELEKDVEHKERWGNQYFELWDEVSRKLAAFESQLVEVRAERPEVQIIRRDYKEHPGAISVDVLLRTIDDLQRAEAAWRSARDCWQAETARCEKHRNELADRNLSLSIEIGSLNTRLQAAEARVRQLESAIKSGFEAVDTYPEPGGTGAGLIPCDTIMEYIHYYREKVLDSIDAALALPQ